MAEVELPKTDELEQLKTRAFDRRVALATSIFAVILAIASLGGNYATKEMLLSQQQASDQWAYFQAKSVKEHQTRTLRLQLEIALAERSAKMPSDVQRKTEALLGQVTEEEKRYEAEKREIEKEAKNLEHERDLNRTKDPYFDFAEVLLQIAIVMASISILADTPALYHFSLFLASLGGFLVLNGYLLLVRLPFLQIGR